jgi:hypothetical protein
VASDTTLDAALAVLERRGLLDRLQSLRVSDLSCDLSLAPVPAKHEGGPAHDAEREREEILFAAVGAGA